MQNFTSTDTERNMAIELILEDVPGGGVIARDDFPAAATELKAGALVAKGSDGIWHLVKTVKLVNAIVTGATTFLVYNNHGLKVGDYIGGSTSAGASGVQITAIAASGTGKDVITATWAGANVAASGVLVAASGLGLSPFVYTPTAITTNAVCLAASGNNGAGLLVRGRVRKSEMSSSVDSTITALLPLIRFV